MHILDLGCGSGRDLIAWNVTALDVITGLDLDRSSLAAAKTQFPHRAYVQAAGEYLPFADESFDRVVSSVALPYMNIPQALAEMRRVLVPGGSVSLSLHLPSFTLHEFLHDALPKPAPTLFRLYVAANGVVFHCTGRTLGFPNGRTESFQTQRGMTLALNRAGFVAPEFTRTPGKVSERFLVTAQKPALRSSAVI